MKLTRQRLWIALKAFVSTPGALIGFSLANMLLTISAGAIAQQVFSPLITEVVLWIGGGICFAMVMVAAILKIHAKLRGVKLADILKALGGWIGGFIIFGALLFLMFKIGGLEQGVAFWGSIAFSVFFYPVVSAIGWEAYKARKEFTWENFNKIVAKFLEAAFGFVFLGVGILLVGLVGALILVPFSDTVARQLDFIHFDLHVVRCPFRTDKVGGEPRPGWFEAPGNELWCQYREKDGNYIKHGLYEAWHTNGQKKIEGYFKNGKRDGPWYEWNADGVLEYKLETKVINGQTYINFPSGWKKVP